MNVLFICIDCLRQDFVASDRADTPFIDELVSDGVYFNNMYSTTTTTTPCVASFMTGCYSEKNGVNSHSYSNLNEDVDTLSELLGEDGYTTSAMVTGPLVTDTSLDRGFDNYWYRDRNDYLSGEWGETARNKISQLQEPFFLYLHLWELHWPIEVPPAYDSAEYGDYPYSRVYSALDRELESVVSDLPDDTIVILHGDHGESLTGRGIPWAVPRYLYRRFVRKTLTYPREIDTRPLDRAINRLVDAISRPRVKDQYLDTGHGKNIRDYTTNVPFLIWSPDLHSTEIEHQVRQIDIFPSILDLLNIDYDGNKNIDGKSFLPVDEISDREAYMRCTGDKIRDGRENSWMRGVRVNDYKYIEYPNRDWSPELYDLTADPIEIKPIRDEILEDKLKEYLPKEGLMQVEKADVDDLLRDLGYL